VCVGRWLFIEPEVARTLGVEFNQLCGRCYPIASRRRFSMDNQLKQPIVTVAEVWKLPKRWHANNRIYFRETLILLRTRHSADI